MDKATFGYREALEATFPGVTIEQYELGMGDELAFPGAALVWLKLKAPERVLIEQGVVAADLLISVKRGSDGVSREGLRITRRKYWTRICACLLDGRYQAGDGLAAARLEERVLTAFRSVWWTGPHPRRTTLAN